MLVLVNLRSVWLLFISCYIIRYREPMPIVRKLNQNSEWDRMNCLKWKDELMDCLKWATLPGPHLRVFQDLKQPRTGLNHSNNVSSFFLILGPILGNECSHLQFRTSLSLESGNFAGTFQYYVIWKDSVDSVWFTVVLLGFKWFCSIFSWFFGLGLTTLSVLGRFCLSEDSVSFWTISAYRWGCHFIWDSVWCNRPGGSCLILDGNVRFQTFPSKQVPPDFDQSNVRIFYPSYLATH